MDGRRRDFFKILPSEITRLILSRLPDLRTVSISKCVCKPWRNFLESDDFVKSKIKFPPALARLTSTKGKNSTRCSIFEIEDGDAAGLDKIHDLHYHPLTNLEIPHGNQQRMEGISANGLLLLHSEDGDPEKPFNLVNPMTREYIELSRPNKYISVDYLLSYGFGVSEISGQYKVICVSRGGGINCINCFHVYTLGTRKWRLVNGGAGSRLGFYSYGHTVCNGKLHWTVSNLRQHLQICGFDVETERLSIFYAPPVGECFGFFSTPPMGMPFRKLSVLKEKLCFCYSRDFEIVIWVMKEYGDADSWTMECTMGTYTFDFDDHFCMDWTKMKCVFPIEIFKDGDVLMLMEMMRLIYYSKKTRKTQQVGIFKDAVAKEDYFTFAMIFTPSLFSLKSFGVENVVTL